MIVHCLFEQSGIFKTEFTKLGYTAYDYDISNKFGNTDFQLDLFKEIEHGVQNKPSIFDNIAKEDLIIAFFPCIRFSSKVLLSFTGSAYGMKDWNIEKKLDNSKKLSIEQSQFYEKFCDLFLIALERNLKLIVENPSSDSQGYLNMHFPIKPDLVDVNRRLLGDYFVKPTQFWFVNLSVQNNKVIQNKEFNFGYKTKYKDTEHTNKGIERSLISPKYAEMFIKKYVLVEEK